MYILFYISYGIKHLTTCKIFKFSHMQRFYICKNIFLHMDILHLP